MINIIIISNVMFIALGVFLYIAQKGISVITGLGIMTFILILSFFMSVNIEKGMTNLTEPEEYCSQSYTLKWFEDHLIKKDIIKTNDSIKLKHFKCDNYLFCMVLVILIYLVLYNIVLQRI